MLGFGWKMVKPVQASTEGNDSDAPWRCTGCLGTTLVLTLGSCGLDKDLSNCNTDIRDWTTNAIDIMRDIESDRKEGEINVETEVEDVSVVVGGGQSVCIATEEIRPTNQKCLNTDLFDGT